LQEKLDPLNVLGASSLIASVAGLAALLRSKQRLSVRNVLAAILYSAVAGLLIALLWYKKFGGDDGDLYFLMGVSGLAGAGGISILDLGIQALRSKGIIINIPSETGDSGDENDSDNEAKKPTRRKL